MDEDELRAAIFEKARTDRQWQKDIVRQYTQNWLSESVDAEYLKNRIQSMIDQTPWIERDVEWSFGLINFVDEGVQDAQECDECQKSVRVGGVSLSALSGRSVNGESVSLQGRGVLLGSL